MGANSKQGKIICVGWQKTGTTSIAKALKLLGYKVIGASSKVNPYAINGDVNAVLKVAEEYDAFQDLPWAALFKELDHHFPGSKFILTTRNEEDWLNSCAKFFGDKHGNLNEWAYGVGVFKGNEELWLNRFRSHYQEVSAYFKNRPADLIEMDLSNGDGWEKLCGFLDKPVPSAPFPHGNKGYYQLTTQEKLKYHLKKMIPKAQRKRLRNIFNKV